MFSNKNSHNWKKPLQLEERDSDARDVSGVKTPLFLAIRAKHLPAIRLLIGAHLNIFHIYCTFSQCFGSGFGLGPNSRRSVDPYPDPDFEAGYVLGSGCGSRRAKMTHKKIFKKYIMF
jgi:hypothetical protein